MVEARAENYVVIGPGSASFSIELEHDEPKIGDGDGGSLGFTVFAVRSMSAPQHYRLVPPGGPCLRGRCRLHPRQDKDSREMADQ
jgi:hypothetical protein